MPLIQNSAARKDVFTMETEVKLTKLASCAGCGAKVGAGTLARLLDGVVLSQLPVGIFAKKS